MNLRHAISGRVAQLQHAWIGRPDRTIFFGQGVGDDLLCTTVAHELKKRGTKRVVMFSKNSALFAGNPDFDGAYDLGYPTIGRLKRHGYGVVIPQYGRYEPETDQDLSPTVHFLVIMCLYAGMTGEIDLKPYLELDSRELAKGRLYPNQAVIQSSGQALMKNKQWLVERYQAVANDLRQDVRWIQLGMAGEPLIEGAVDLRGRTTLRESAAIIANSRVHLGQAGFLMHVARAVGTRAVIVYGGRENPAISGYRCFENIVGRTPCSYCWQRTRCDFGHECMRMITVEEVVAAVRRQLDQIGIPLEIEKAIL